MDPPISNWELSNLSVCLQASVCETTEARSKIEQGEREWERDIPCCVREDSESPLNVCMHVWRVSCVIFSSRRQWAAWHNNKTQWKHRHDCFCLKISPKVQHTHCLPLGCICESHHVTHAMSLGATLSLIRLDICPMLPLLWPRPSHVGQHWHSRDWYMSQTQCCSFWDWRNSDLCPAALQHITIAATMGIQQKH